MGEILKFIVLLWTIALVLSICFGVVVVGYALLSMIPWWIWVVSIGLAAFFTYNMHHD